MTPHQVDFDRTTNYATFGPIDVASRTNVETGEASILAVDVSRRDHPARVYLTRGAVAALCDWLTLNR